VDAGGRVERIFVAPLKGAPMRELAVADALAGQGLEGDRKVAPGREPAAQLTLIEAEAIEAFRAAVRQVPAAHASRGAALLQGPRRIARGDPRRRPRPSRRFDRAAGLATHCPSRLECALKAVTCFQ